MRHQSRGFTAVELMVVIAIVAILTALALPSFSHLMAKLQVEKDIEALRASIYLARSEAMKLGGGVRLQKLTAAEAGMPASTCGTGGTDWSCGWKVININATAPNDVIKQYASSGKTDIMLSGTSSTVLLDRWGVTNAGFGLNVKHSTMTGSDLEKEVCVSMGGAVTVKDSCTS